ncbi:MAG: twin-arginine translocase TatA/TatE family subunit [Lachnospiraceae bacterium]|nr:twin-arginine translocase TatA/TatE family subunit [Lachnospiraceae bacterium]
MRIGVPELVVILLIVVIVFGPTQIPKLTKMFGKSIKEFREGMAEEEDKNEHAGSEKEGE